MGEKSNVFLTAPVEFWKKPRFKICRYPLDFPLWLSGQAFVGTSLDRFEFCLLGRNFVLVGRV